MKLEFKTPEMGDPRGKPKVYFSCHPADREAYFETLTDEVLAHSTCAIWYDTEPEADYDRKELLGILGDMQLMVFGVTQRFLLQPNRAREVELPFALEKHIPVLPILVEPGLEWDFNKICAEVQLVNRNVADPTATPYEDVLDTFLKSVLIGDELAAKVRDAFDAYVFLSYRKKDRSHAQRLMRLIHENEQFRDIAIWYDEYLVPGEDFNGAIRDAFNKSGLFALAVTPHLLEAGNYVQEIEYPLAQDRKKKQQDMEIVPVEMYEEDTEDQRTNMEELKKGYKEIPPVRDEHNRPVLNSALLEALHSISIKENDGSSTHQFFIGLAYLCGIDVEVNYERALKLIRSASQDPEDPCCDATDKLVDMYRTGEGVKRDLREALKWQRTLTEQLRAAYDAHHDPDEHKGYGTRTFRAMMKLSDLQRELGDSADALRTAEEALAFGKKLKDEVGIRETDRDTAVIHNRIGGLYRDRRDYPRAKEHYREALEIYERLAREMGTARARRDLSIGLERTGDLYRKIRDPGQAEQAYTRALQLREELAGDGTEPGPRRDLASILVKLGNIRKGEKDYGSALELYRRAEEIDRVLAAEEKTDLAKDDYGVSLLKTGDIFRKMGANREAAAAYGKAVETFSGIAERTDSLRSRKSLATALEKSAKAYDALGNREEEGRCIDKALWLREEAAGERPSDTTSHELAVTCYQAALFRRDAETMRRALEIWEKLSEKDPENREYRENAVHAREALKALDPAQGSET